MVLVKEVTALEEVLEIVEVWVKILKVVLEVLVVAVVVDQAVEVFKVVLAKVEQG